MKKPIPPDIRAINIARAKGNYEPYWAAFERMNYHDKRVLYEQLQADMELWKASDTSPQRGSGCEFCGQPTAAKRITNCGSDECRKKRRRAYTSKQNERDRLRTKEQKARYKR